MNVLCRGYSNDYLASHSKIGERSESQVLISLNLMVDAVEGRCLQLRRTEVETWAKLYLSFFDSHIVSKPEQWRSLARRETILFTIIHLDGIQTAVNAVLLLSSNRVICLFRHRLEEAIPGPRRAKGRYESARAIKGRKLSTFFKLSQEGSKSNSLFPSFFQHFAILWRRQNAEARAWRCRPYRRRWKWDASKTARHRFINSAPTPKPKLSWTRWNQCLWWFFIAKCPFIYCWIRLSWPDSGWRGSSSWTIWNIPYVAFLCYLIHYDMFWYCTDGKIVGVRYYAGYASPGGMFFALSTTY